MIDNYGVVLLDKEEVIIRIYQKDKENKITKTYNKLYDLTNFSNKNVLPEEIVEIIAQNALNPVAAHVIEWKLCSRNVPESTVGQVSYITNIPAEILTLTREQDLICNAIANEF